MEKNCKNCKFWQPNGGILGMGYCKADKWTYRKPIQTCQKWESHPDGVDFKDNVVIR